MKNLLDIQILYPEKKNISYISFRFLFVAFFTVLSQYFVHNIKVPTAMFSNLAPVIQ
jgi:hypothetical protein